MKIIKVILLSVLLFLWINLALQFFVVSKLLVGLSFIISVSISYYVVRSEKSEFIFDKKYFLAIPLLVPVLWQAFRVIYIEANKLFVFNANNLGDMPYHLGLANYLQHIQFWPKNYIYAEEALKYPFAVDYLHALLQNFLSYQYVYPLLTILGLLLIVASTVRVGGIALLYIVFCNGSLWLLPQEQVSWKNFFLTIYIPQRGYLLALPMGLLLLHRLWKFVAEQKDFTVKEAVVFGFILGSLAWVHLHTYVFFAIFATYLFFKWNSKYLFLTLAVGAVIGFPFIVVSTDAFTKASSIRWLWLWDKPSEEATLPFLFKNLGFVLLLPLVLPFIKRQASRYWLLGASSLFAVFLICILSMWPWDNIKILLWAYIAFMFVLLKEITNLKIKVLVVLLLAAPGFYTIVHSTFVKPNPQLVFNLDEVEAYKAWFENGQHLDTNYIVAPTYNHPIFMYGASVLMGYDGHLWSHGVNYVSTQKKYEDMKNYNVEEWREFAAQSGAKYLIYSERERQVFGSILSLENFEKSYSYKDLVIYKID